MFYKMSHNLVPDYLCKLVPETVGARVGCYVLRNSGDMTTIRTKKTQLYMSFLPKTVRDWNNNINNWRALDFLPSLDSFKANYKKQLFRAPNKNFNIELEDGNIHLARLRLGLSHLRAQLFYYNLINDPTCQFCNMEPETVDHYLLRCPSFHAARTNYLLGLTMHLDINYIRHLDDRKKVNLFLYGDNELNDMLNEILVTMALTFINSSKRFDRRIVY